MNDTTRRRRGRRERRTQGPPRLHVYTFRFEGQDGGRHYDNIQLRGRTNHTEGIAQAYTEAHLRGGAPWLVDIRSLPMPRPTRRLDALTRRCTAFASFLDLLIAPAGYRPSLRLDLLGQDGVCLARAYDHAQSRWGDPRRAFVTGEPPRRKMGGGHDSA